MSLLRALFNRYAVLVYAFLVVSAVCTEAEQDEQSADPTISKAVSLRSPGFLKPPAGIDSKAFVLAETAPEVDVCFFAGLEDRGKGTLWSSWGDGCVASNGMYYTSVGDHLGLDANSYVYEYNPMKKVLRRVVNVLRAIAQMLGLYGHGKIHAAIHEGADGRLYFTTYWGKPKEVEAAFAKGFPGSLLLRYDPKTGQVENLGAPVPKQGLPASYFDPARQLLYFHAVYKGDITVYDLKAQKVKFLGGADESAAHRTFIGDLGTGKVYFSGSGGALHYYDPKTNSLGKTKAKLPAATIARKKGEKGDTLRASVHRPTKDGILYGMTSNGQLFAFDPKTESVKDLGPNFLKGDYTAVMAMSPDEKYLYYAPGAHGSGSKTGAPVVQYNVATGQRKVLAFLQAPLREQVKYSVGGTYNLQIDPSGERLFITFNGAPLEGNPRRTETFGKPSVVVLHIPPSERQ